MTKTATEKKAKPAEGKKGPPATKAASKPIAKKPKVAAPAKTAEKTSNLKINPNWGKTAVEKKGDFRPKLYFAAALFATRECIYNIELAHYIEAKGYPVMVP